MNSLEFPVATTFEFLDSLFAKGKVIIGVVIKSDCRACELALFVLGHRSSLMKVSIWNGIQFASRLFAENPTCIVWNRILNAHIKLGIEG